jgi:hypothetical protein
MFELGFSLFSLAKVFGELVDCTNLVIRLWYVQLLHLMHINEVFICPKLV